MYYTYMLRCEDNSIYTGITTDLKRRMDEHFTQVNNCAKYTSTHKAKKLEAAWQSENRVLASKLEFNIKRLKKQEKETIIKNNYKMQELLEDKIDGKEYKSVNLGEYSIEVGKRSL